MWKSVKENVGVGVCFFSGCGKYYNLQRKRDREKSCAYMCVYVCVCVLVCYCLSVRL